VRQRRLLLAALGAAAAAGFSVSYAADPVAPKGYVIGEITVTDPAGYKRYAAKAGPIVARYGGRYLARGGRTQAIDGAPPADRVVIVEFDSLAAAMTFETSPEYREAAELRRRSSTGRFFVVEGVAGPVLAN
jgi:uncharacterized protein (DUF1330 family)